MAHSSWWTIKFLESSSNLREVLRQALGREIPGELANQISACLQQGRLFFEAAEGSPWEIKPLLIYYGMVGFAKAIATARGQKKLESLPRSHGLSDVTPDNARLTDLVVKVEEKRGTFHEMNDACRSLEKLIVHRDKEKAKISHPTVDANSLAKSTITLKEILARIPDLEPFYRLTFNESPCVMWCSHFTLGETKQWIEFEVFPYQPVNGLGALEENVKLLKDKFKFLQNWLAMYAGETSITFANIKWADRSEFRPDLWAATSYGFKFQGAIGTGGSMKLEDLISTCDPIRGNLTPEIEEACLIQPYHDMHIGEISLYYLAMYLLSSLVRYQPNLWANAISRRAIAGRAVDDQALALIEEFIRLSLKVFPDAVSIALKEPAG